MSEHGTGRIRHLSGSDAAEERTPSRSTGEAEAHPMRIVTEEVLVDPEHAWSSQRRLEVAGFFDELAVDWDERHAARGFAALEDAWLRGGPVPSGRCLEVGSGTGRATPWLAERCEQVVCVDIAEQMLVRAPAGPGARLLADAAALPLASASIDVAVLLNAFLFPAELLRVLAPDAAVVWVNSSGPNTPIHLSAERVAQALGDNWTGVASTADGGTWAVLRRSSDSSASAAPGSARREGDPMVQALDGGD